MPSTRRWPATPTCHRRRSIPDGSVTVSDNGRGIPTDIHTEEGISAAEVIMTQLHAGGNSTRIPTRSPAACTASAYPSSTRCRALLVLTIRRSGKIHQMRFHDGVAEAPLARSPAMRATRPALRSPSAPSPQTFTMLEFDFATLEHRLRELAFLNSGVRMILTDNRGVEPQSEELIMKAGWKPSRAYLDRAKNPLIEDAADVEAERRRSLSKWRCGGTTATTRTCLCFTNNIPQRDGGTHLAGFRGALTRQVNGYAERAGIAKKEKVSLTGEDCREGLTCVLSVKVPDPKFSSQTKDKLVSSEVRPVVENVVNEALSRWFEEHPAPARIIVSRW